MTDLTFELIISVLELPMYKDKSGKYYYRTGWGKKTPIGLKKTLEKIIENKDN